MRVTNVMSAMSLVRLVWVLWTPSVVAARKIHSTLRGGVSLTVLLATQVIYQGESVSPVHQDVMTAQEVQGYVRSAEMAGAFFLLASVYLRRVCSASQGCMLGEEHV